MNYHTIWEFVSADLRTDDTKLVRIARKLSKLEPKVQLRNFPSVEQIQDGSFERFPSKLKKFENSLKLPWVLFSISLIIYSKLTKGLKILWKCQQLKWRKSENKCSLLYSSQTTSDRKNLWYERTLQKIANCLKFAICTIWYT